MHRFVEELSTLEDPEDVQGPEAFSNVGHLTANV